MKHLRWVHRPPVVNHCSNRTKPDGFSIRHYSLTPTVFRTVFSVRTLNDSILKTSNTYRVWRRTRALQAAAPQALDNCFGQSYRCRPAGNPWWNDVIVVNDCRANVASRRHSRSDPSLPAQVQRRCYSVTLFYGTGRPKLVSDGLNVLCFFFKFVYSPNRLPITSRRVNIAVVPGLDIPTNFVPVSSFFIYFFLTNIFCRTFSNKTSPPTRFPPVIR